MFAIYSFMFTNSIFKDSNGLNPSTDTLPCVSHVSQAIVRVDSGPGRTRIKFWGGVVLQKLSLHLVYMMFSVNSVQTYSILNT
jgi:hypothetical protein